jgi:hypothetical protein
MRRSDAARVLLAAGLALAAAVARPEERTFTVSSEPSGARVWSITGELGTTPLGIGERSIYPNRFPEERIDDYGKLFVSHPGCTTLTHAVTLDDVAEGMALTLDCSPGEGGVAIEDLGAGPWIASSAVTPADADESPHAQRRLRQLRLLEELLEDGIITAEEERAIRRRLLAR